jgi:hypothetical protein
MANELWADEENDLMVADYFAMLAEDTAGCPYNKAQHRRSLMPLLLSRTVSGVAITRWQRNSMVADHRPGSVYGR